MTPGWIALIVIAVIVVVAALAFGLGFGLTSGSTPVPTPTPSPIPVDPVLVPNSVYITNSTSRDPLQLQLQISSTDFKDVWVHTSGGGTLGPPTHDEKANPHDFQLATIPAGVSMVVQMPQIFQPWRVTPLSVNQGGMPTLMECGKNVVCDMSAVDGVNYLLDATLTVGPNGAITFISFNTSPCSTPGEGCINPSVNGTFLPGKNPSSAPCPFGTCNLTGDSLLWANTIHTGQCANSSSTWTIPCPNDQPCAPSCQGSPPSFTTYTYSHDDSNSSPYLRAPFQVVLVYKDL